MTTAVTNMATPQMDVTVPNGDVFGARAKADGAVEVYRNGVLLGTGKVSAWTYNAMAGASGCG